MIDLSVCSLDISLSSYASTLKDRLGIYHFPIIAKVLFNNSVSVSSLHFGPRLNIKKADWVGFSAAVDGFLLSQSSLISYNSFISCVNYTAILLKFCKWEPLFLVEKFCSKVNNNIESLFIAKRHIARVKHFLITKKRLSFREYCATMIRDTPSGEI